MAAAHSLRAMGRADTTVYIGPAAHFPADGRMVDPETSSFWVSWQEGLLLSC